MALEINLVPDIKDEMIRTLKLRNLIFFICIVVAAASVGVSLIFASIAAGQQAVADGKKGTLELLSKKLNSYSDLGDFLTIKDQLSNLSEISDDKQLLSRSFSVLSALLPTGLDTITISELSIMLSKTEPTFTFDAQANAGAAPFIDYNVLDSFKKSMQYMRYDYGRYVDRYGSEIPAYCIVESGLDGATFADPERGYYALWLINGENCNPTPESEEPEEDSVEESEENESTEESQDTEAKDAEKPTVIAGYPVEEYNGQPVVRIWRTPQFKEWYAEEEKENKPYMDLSGSISNVAHFESSCTTYTGHESENGTVTFRDSNEGCLLVPGGIEGISITDSSNGRGASDELVLRFSATIALNPEVFNFTNKHMRAVAPAGRVNVTDSYIQIQNMFAQRAEDCANNDTACNGNIGGN